MISLDQGRVRRQSYHHRAVPTEAMIGTSRGGLRDEIQATWQFMIDEALKP